jgi:homospermidine synthase
MLQTFALAAGAIVLVAAAVLATMVWLLNHPVD